MPYRELAEKLDRVISRQDEVMGKLDTVEADVAATKELVEAWAALKTTGRFLKWLSGVLAAVSLIWAIAKAAALGYIAKIFS